MLTGEWQKDVQHFLIFPHTQEVARKIRLVVFKHLASQECLGQQTRQETPTRSVNRGHKRPGTCQPAAYLLLTKSARHYQLLYFNGIQYFIFKTTDKINKHLNSMEYWLQ